MSATNNAKELLLHNLRIQESYMRKNAEMIQEIYGNNAPNAQELKGAATITQDWIEQIQQETNQ